MAQSKKIESSVQPHEKADDFRGYTMEELRYQRAMMALRKEFCKSKVLNRVDRLAHPAKEKEPKNLPGILGKVGNAFGTIGKFIPHLSVLEYASLGISAIGTGRKIYKSISNKKK